MEYTKGEHAVYPRCGVVTVVELTQKEIAGQLLTFYVCATASERILVPVGKAAQVGLRRLIGPDQVGELVEILRQPGDDQAREAWVRRQRHYDQKLRSGSIHEVAEVVRDLRLRREEKQLSCGERRMLDESLGLLTTEVATNTGRRPEEVVAMLGL